MKHTSLILLLPFLLAAFSACEQAKERIQVYYDQNTKKHLKEEYYITRPNPRVKDGAYRNYYPNGNLKMEATYKDGFLWQLNKVCDQQGNVLAEHLIDEGKGVYKQYKASGALEMEVPYEFGLPNGTARLYNFMGEPVMKIYYHDGVILEIENLLDANAFGMNLNSADSMEAVGENEASEIIQSGFEKVADNIMRQFQNGQYEQMYQQAHPEYRKNFTYNAFSNYAQYLIKLYGKLESFKFQAYNMSKAAGSGEAIEALYDVKFRYTKASVLVVLSKSGDAFRLITLDVQAPDYFPAPMIASVCSETIDLINNEAFDKLYNEASEKFRELTPKDRYMKLMSDFRKQGTIKDPEIFRHQVSLADNRIVVGAMYQAKLAGKDIMLNFTLLQENGALKLGGITPGPANAGVPGQAFTP